MRFHFILMHFGVHGRGSTIALSKYHTQLNMPAAAALRRLVAHVQEPATALL